MLLEGIADRAPGPEARYETKEAIELGFIVGLQHLSPPQRAVLVLRDVLGYRAEEVAEMLDTTAQSVNSLLRRARASFESRLPAAGRERAPWHLTPCRKRDTVRPRFAGAIQTGDIDGIVALLTEAAAADRHAAQAYEYQGPARIGAFLQERTITRGSPLLVPTRANTQPAFGAYFQTSQSEIARLYGILVLTLEGPQNPPSDSPGSVATAPPPDSGCRRYSDSSRSPARTFDGSIRRSAEARIGQALHTDERRAGLLPSGLLPLPAHVGVAGRLGHEVGHHLAELGRVPAVTLVGGRPFDPAFGHAEVVALDVEDAPGDAGLDSRAVEPPRRSGRCWPGRRRRTRRASSPR